MDTERARELLEAERRRLQGIIDNANEGDFGEAEQERSSDVLSYDEQPSDAAQTIFDREEELSIVGHAEAELREVEHAVRKLDEGTYGLDEESGEPIPDERLEAMPATRFTVRNQRIDEKRAGVPDDRTTGDPTATSGGGRLAR
jgi:RNA polymerase-binding transcription factor DksA